MLTITLPDELQMAISQRAFQEGLTTESLTLKKLNELFLSSPVSDDRRDEALRVIASGKYAARAEDGGYLSDRFAAQKVKEKRLDDRSRV